VTPPPLGFYPASFTSFNFIALSFLLPRLIDEEQAQRIAGAGGRPGSHRGGRRKIANRRIARGESAGTGNPAKSGRRRKPIPPDPTR